MYDDFNDQPKRPNKLIIILVGLAIILSFGLGLGLSYVIRTAPKVRYEKIPVETQKFADLYEFLEKHHHKEFDPEKADVYELQAIIQSLEDPYTRITPLQLVAVDPADKGESDVPDAPIETFEGLGVSFTYHDYYADISEVMRHSPAEKAKIFPKDHIIGVVENGKRLIFADAKTPQEEALAHLKGKAGDEKSVIVKRPNGAIQTINVTYERFSTPTVITQKINDNVGYLRITQFEETTTKVFPEKLKALETEVLTGTGKTLIIDLRNNPGGYLSTVGSIMNQLLPKQTVPIFGTQSTNKNSQKSYIPYYGGLTEKKPYDIKVLVNSHSASASEMLAAALYYTGGYTIYGEPTFGKNVYQNTVTTFRYKYGFDLTYTEGYWFYTIGGVDSPKIMDKEKNPIPVVKLPKDGFLGLDVPTYTKDIKYDSVNLELVNVQKFLKVKYGEEVRTDGYFDTKTKELIERYQTEKSLSVNGDYNLETHHEMYMEYLLTLDDKAKDPQVQKMIEKP